MTYGLPSIFGAMTLLVGVPLNVYAFVFLRRLNHEEPNAITQLMMLIFFLLAAASLLFGLVFISNDMSPTAWTAWLSIAPILNPDQTRWITRTIFVLATLVPPIVLIWRYFRQR